MADWTSIPWIYRAYSYFNKYYDLSKKEIDINKKDNKLKDLEQKLSTLTNIEIDNSKNYLEMVDFNPYQLYMDASDTSPAPYLEFRYYITNRSIFNLKTRKISMKILVDSYEIGHLDKHREIDIPRQKSVFDKIRLQPLHQNFVTKLKSSKRENKPVTIRLDEIYIDFTGDRKFTKKWERNFDIKVCSEDINVTL